jgi:hypothetical protein
VQHVMRVLELRTRIRIAAFFDFYAVQCPHRALRGILALCFSTVSACDGPGRDDATEWPDRHEWPCGRESPLCACGADFWVGMSVSLCSSFRLLSATNAISCPEGTRRASTQKSKMSINVIR